MCTAEDKFTELQDFQLPRDTAEEKFPELGFGNLSKRMLSMILEF